MRLGFVAPFAFVLLTASIACSSSATGEPSSSGGPSSPSPSPTGSSPSTPSSDGGGGGGDGGGVPASSTSEAPVDVDGTCATFAACGGALAGTYDYVSGCVDDVLAPARKSCPSIDATGVKVTVKGSLHFIGSALTRAVTTTTSGTVVIPATCAMGQCAAAESLLKGVFDSVSCTGSSSCTCTISDVAKIDSATTFSVSGTTVTTADGDNYAFCASGSKLEYRGKSAGAEEGVWTLQKR